MNQKTALEILKDGHNVFLTGPAGSGKTYLLNLFIKHLKNEGKAVAVTASTGIAATHMNGRTVHSWSGMGIRTIITEHDLKRIARNSKTKGRISRTKTLIIDEISMLNARQLDNVDKICRRFKEPFLPFGGMQVILCGDFFQLPPVNKGGKEDVKFAYFSQAWQEMSLKICYLDEQHRQKDNLMIGALNDIRGQKVTDQTRKLILSRERKAIAGFAKPTKLFTHNIDADAVNVAELEKINYKPVAYLMRSGGNKQLVEYLKKGCLAPERLVLKKGAQVMFVRNNFDKGYVNGTLGVVVGFDAESKMPVVKTTRGKEIIALPETWAVDDYDRTLAEITQLPLRLAWAITVHKSQGMSLDAAEIDLRKSFEYGMGYVALSRVRTLEGISLLGMNETALEINPEIFELDKKLLEMSNEAEKMMIVKKIVV